MCFPSRLFVISKSSFLRLLYLHLELMSPVHFPYLKMLYRKFYSPCVHIWTKNIKYNKNNINYSSIIPLLFNLIVSLNFLIRFWIGESHRAHNRNVEIEFLLSLLFYNNTFRRVSRVFAVRSPISARILLP